MSSGITRLSIIKIPGSNSGGTLTGANDGVSLNGTVVVLGQTVGAAGDPAQLTENREIPLNGNVLTFKDGTPSHGHVVMPGLLITDWFGSPDGQASLISTYSAPVTVFNGGYSAGFEEYSFPIAEVGFFGYIGVQSWAYIQGGNGATHNKFSNGYIVAFSGAQVWDGNQNGGNQLIGNIIGTFSALNSQSGTATNAFDFYASELNSVGVTTTSPNVTNHYALYAENFTKATNNYGVYINGTQSNYFGGKVGIGQTSPTALLHLKAGTATAGTSPIKLTSGTLLTTPETGSIEYNGTHFYATIGSTRFQLDQQVTSANVILNQTSQQASSNFNISGNGIVGGSLNATGVLSSSSTSQIAGVTNSGVTINGGNNFAYVSLFDQNQTVNNRTGELIFISGQLQLRFLNDAHSTAAVPLSITGGQASGITGIASNSGSGSWIHTGSFTATGIINTSIGLFVKEGSNAKQGIATLVAGTVTVSNTAVTAESRIFLTGQDDNGGTPGFLRVSARVAGTSFTITSSSNTDTSIVAYEIFEPGS